LKGGGSYGIITNSINWVAIMQKDDFKRIRKILNKSQKEMASLLGLSKKAVESYEQGLRNIPANTRRILYFLLFKLNRGEFGKREMCWQKKKCSTDIRKNCVAWMAREGYFCWFITGRVCEGERQLGDNSCESCFECWFFMDQLSKIIPPE